MNFWLGVAAKPLTGDLAQALRLKGGFSGSESFNAARLYHYYCTLVNKSTQITTAKNINGQAPSLLLDAL
jgi:hypothetical protein